MSSKALGYAHLRSLDVGIRLETFATVLMTLSNVRRIYYIKCGWYMLRKHYHM